ncbi:MAG: hypothetical protein HGGPFJEG_01899 [Ignavibacteria bacterium]|nr:hypothetical protein [Ignavibacteria bacterium]
MGEFTFSMVNMLLSNGIRCVSSATERVSKEIDDRKISEFRFVKFRVYLRNENTY